MNNPFASLPDAVVRELQRLHATERAAEEKQDTHTVVATRLLWAELYLAHGATRSPALPHLNSVVDDARAPIAAARDRWLRRLKARPLVAITKRDKVTWRDSAGCEHFYYAETLACGHKHTDVAFMPGAPLARRRRCAECGDAKIKQQRSGNMVSIAVAMPLSTLSRLEVTP